MTDISYRVKSSSPEQTLMLGETLGRRTIAGDIILLEGKLGAGKTCLTRGMAQGLGITDYVMSPTFVLVRELKGRLPLYHIDLYRLDNLNEIDDLGLDEYFYGQGLSVVEWADKAISLLPPEYLLIRMDYAGGDRRLLELIPHGTRYLKFIEEIK